ncbi:hypothetical protein [Listeria cornellensis]|uniref:Membrane-spanning protein n=1 Tax=Listeria cornellensis FSL F6-0969 TaxID=1265820 RepID=W7C743_9LIST|nr:hypothetical protein [Listeria cornellensis]EUJ31506.1 hypothetical protein PCORN_05661 [Listeria cornellensis FSL F6-0969]
MKKTRKWNWTKIIAIFIFASLLVSLVFSIYNLITTPETGVPAGEPTRSDYSLMVSQCILGLVAMFLPSILGRRFKFEIPGNMYLVFIIFLYCSIYLGEVQSFYYLIPNWDTILHTFSGAMLGALGFSVISFLNEDERTTMNLSPAFVALFAVCFAVTLGVVWEFYEFASDRWLGMNMQKTMLEDGTKLAGTAAVTDTMEDLFVDFLGAFVFATIGYINLKRKKGWMEKFEFKKTVKK